jgi:hypothetical protein
MSSPEIHLPEILGFRGFPFRGYNGRNAISGVYGQI